MPHFLDLAAPGAPALRAIVREAHARKAMRAGLPRGEAEHDAPLAGRTLAMVFEKPSTRTRFSFDAAIRQLGGASIIAGAGEMQLGRGETVADTARVLSRYVDAVMLRTADPATLAAFAAHSTVPVINGLTDAAHPCQVLADVMTAEERLDRTIAGTRWAWLGDGNNMANSLIEAAGLLGFTVRLGVPAGHDPDPAIVAGAGAAVEIVRDPGLAVAMANVVATDTWVSMGQPESEAKLAAMRAYQVNPELMGLAAPGAIFLHCLPAHRGDEVVDAVIDGPTSAVWDEAENRLHIQKAILLWCFDKLPAA